MTTNNLLGCELVLMTGEVLRLGGKHLDAGGYDLLGIVTGSEGLLGVITEVTWWCHADEPFLSAERAQALRNQPVARNAREAEPDMREMHDPQPRLAIVQDALRFAHRLPTFRFAVAKDARDPFGRANERA